MFSPYKVGKFTFKNRVVMPGMTRCRSDPKTGVPNDLVKEYYTQRSVSACLIITEAMPINAYCNPWPGSSAVWHKDALPVWRSITDAVRKNNCYIFAQLFHAGRLVHPDLANGRKPISSSPVKLSGETFVASGKKPYEIPQEMNHAQIKEVIEDFVTSFKHAKEAGFDGIEISAGTGLLLDQFMQSRINKRNDEYGGSIQNRCRFTLQVVDAALKHWDPSQIGLKLSFVGRSFESYDDNPWETMAYLLPELDKRGILYVNIVESEDYVKENNGSLQIENCAKEVRKHWKRTIITNGFRPIEERFRKIEAGEADLATFARYFISNPDLAERLKNDWPLAEPNKDTFYAGGAHGYIDYPKYQETTKK